MFIGLCEMIKEQIYGEHPVKQIVADAEVVVVVLQFRCLNVVERRQYHRHPEPEVRKKTIQGSESHGFGGSD